MFFITNHWIYMSFIENILIPYRWTMKFLLPQVSEQLDYFRSKQLLITKKKFGKWRKTVRHSVHFCCTWTNFLNDISVPYIDFNSDDLTKFIKWKNDKNWLMTWQQVYFKSTHFTFDSLLEIWNALNKNINERENDRFALTFLINNPVLVIWTNSYRCRSLSRF